MFPSLCRIRHSTYYFFCYFHSSFVRIILEFIGRAAVAIHITCKIRWNTLSLRWSMACKFIWNFDFRTISCGNQRKNNCVALHVTKMETMQSVASTWQCVGGKADWIPYEKTKRNAENHYIIVFETRTSSDTCYYLLLHAFAVVSITRRRCGYAWRTPCELVRLCGRAWLWVREREFLHFKIPWSMQTKF